MDQRRHSLEVNLRRVGLPVHVMDQVIAEVEDSLWLALKLEEAEDVGRRQEHERMNSRTHG